MPTSLPPTPDGLTKHQRALFDRAIRHPGLGEALQTFAVLAGDPRLLVGILVAIGVPPAAAFTLVAHHLAAQVEH